jgi:hypothetical protein
MSQVHVLYSGLLVLCGSCLGFCEQKKIMNLKPIPVYLFMAVVAMILCILFGAIQGQFPDNTVFETPSGNAVWFFVLFFDAVTSVFL